MYVYVCDQYLHVLQVLDHWGMETTTASPKHPLLTQHPGGPTQDTPVHVPDHFLTPSHPPPSDPSFRFFRQESVRDVNEPVINRLGFKRSLASLYLVDQPGGPVKAAIKF